MKTKTGPLPKRRFPAFRTAGAWEEKRLGKVATFLKGKGISKAEVSPNGSLPCIRYGELYTHYQETIDAVVSYTDLPAKDLVFSRANDVIIPASGETQIDIATASCVVHGGIALGGDLNIIRSDINGVFLSYYLNGSKKTSIAKMAQGISVVHLYPSQLTTLKIGIPTLLEQQKIADCLTSVADLITAQRQKVEALKAHKKGLMQQLFPQQGTPPRHRFPEFRDTGDWEEKRLSTFVNLLSGVHLAPNMYRTTGETPYFTGPSDFTDDIRSVTKWTDEPANAAKQHDTLITVKGSGVGQIWNLILPSVAMGRQLMAVRTESGDPRFTYQFLSTKKTRFEALASGNLIPGLSRGDILDMVTPIPSGDEQRRIADCLTSIDDLIMAEAQKLDALKAHKKGLMQQLFPASDEVGG